MKNESTVEGRRQYIPALPTLWPSMLGGHSPAAEVLPFSAPNRSFLYLARNAVWLAARLLGLDHGEVLVPAYHHGVEVEALVDAGAKVSFYRVGSHWDVDPDDVERRIGPKTRALYLIHYAGFPGPIDALREIADRRGLPLIEDCALSMLSSDGDRPLGSTGDVSIFCLYKTLPVPHGGALVVNGPRSFALPEPLPPGTGTTLRLLATSFLQNVELRFGASGRRLRSAARFVGRRGAQLGKMNHVPTGTARFDRRHVDLGMHPLAFRVARAQEFHRIVAARRRNFFYLLGRLKDLGRPIMTELPAGVCPLFFPLRVDDKPALLARLGELGVEAVDFWSEFHPACSPSQFPEVADLRRHVIEIPCHQDLGPDEMAYVATSVRSVIEGLRPRALPRAGQGA